MSPHLLLIEPDQERRILLVRRLRHQGWLVHGVRDTSQAVRLLLHRRLAGPLAAVAVDQTQTRSEPEQVASALGLGPLPRHTPVLAYLGPDPQQVEQMLESLNDRLHSLPGRSPQAGRGVAECAPHGTGLGARGASATIGMQVACPDAPRDPLPGPTRGNP